MHGRRDGVTNQRRPLVNRAYGFIDISLSKAWPWPAAHTQIFCVSGLCSTQLSGLTQLWLMWQSRWLNSDSTKIPNLLTWLNSDSTQIPNLLTWLNSDWTHFSQSWVISYSRLITFNLILPKLLTGGGGGGGGLVRPNATECWFCLLWGYK